jgi:protein-S-isoprenylcysteine O-methyltransferase Ste14
MITYEDIILLCWALFLIVWGVSAFNVKRDIRGGSQSKLQQYWVSLVIAIGIIFVAIRVTTGTAHFANSPIFSSGIFSQFLWLGWIGAALTVIGVSCAIWARVYLGRNWSPRPAVKEEHELVTTGPYAYVRHPIYSGVMLMAFGNALSGSIFSVGVFLGASLVFILRIEREEKIMLELFPNAYPEYQKRTKRLVPFVW